MVTTDARRIIDYVSNEIDYTNQTDAYKQNSNEWKWKVVTVKELFGNAGVEDDLINAMFEDRLGTYNVLITTDGLSGELKPQASGETPNSKEISLILSTLISNTTNTDNLVYTNLTEIIETYNSVGRRMKLSKTGNQAMPYQSDDRSIDESTTWVHPDEVDTDSGQKVQVSTPTGENKNYNRIIVIALCALGLLVVLVVIIRNRIKKKQQ